VDIGLFIFSLVGLSLSLALGGINAIVFVGIFFVVGPLAAFWNHDGLGQQSVQSGVFLHSRIERPQR
jgi:hypothetical protein